MLYKLVFVLFFGYFIQKRTQTNPFSPPVVSLRKIIGKIKDDGET